MWRSEWFLLLDTQGLFNKCEKRYNTKKAINDLKSCIIIKSGQNKSPQDIDPFSKYYSECAKEKLIRDVKWEIDKLTRYIAENIFFLKYTSKNKGFQSSITYIYSLWDSYYIRAYFLL